ncbi:MAG TPA: class II glutamine amidotransferase [Kofleriaceae bacterium]
MCELLGMSARFPTTLHLSMDELGRHGGGSGPHRDGWGIGFLHDNDAIVLREPLSAYTSDWLAFVQQQNPKSHTILAHIRRATLGSRTLRNTQPFARELGGRMHLFAHNGMVHDVAADPHFVTKRFRPIGDTDSEHAFCALLERLAPLYEQARVPTLEDRLATVADFAADLRGLGPANFIYSDGDTLFAHGHRRMNASGTIEPPGLHVLCRRCSADSDGVELAGITVEHHAEQHVALIASVPLSNEGWQPLAEGEVVAVREGQLVRRIEASPRASLA